MLTDLSPTAGLLPFDRDGLVRYFESHLPEIGKVLAIRQFKGGQSNPTYLIEADAARIVLRKKPNGPILSSAHQIEREYRIMQALAYSGIPVPRMYLLCDDTAIVGTSFYVMEAVEGRIFHDCAMPNTPPHDRQAMYLGMAETLADLHRVDWRAIGLEDFGKADAYLERQVARWTKQFQKTQTQPIAEMDKLCQWLGTNLPEDQPATIAHGDYRLGNLVFDPVECRVRAVLDWELATIGHPMADLAYMCLPYRLESGLPGLPGLADIDLDALGIPSELDIVQAYCARTRRDGIPNWNYYLAFALFRTAAILQGIYARSLQNNAANEDARQVGQSAAYVARVGWACARGEAAAG